MIYTLELGKMWNAIYLIDLIFCEMNETPQEKDGTAETKCSDALQVFLDICYCTKIFKFSSLISSFSMYIYI